MTLYHVFEVTKLTYDGQKSVLECHTLILYSQMRVGPLYASIVNPNAWWRSYVAIVKPTACLCIRRSVTVHTLHWTFNSRLYCTKTTSKKSFISKCSLNCTVHCFVLRSTMQYNVQYPTDISDLKNSFRKSFIQKSTLRCTVHCITLHRKLHSTADYT